MSYGAMKRYIPLMRSAFPGEDSVREAFLAYLMTIPLYQRVSRARTVELQRMLDNAYRVLGNDRDEFARLEREDPEAAERFFDV